MDSEPVYTDTTPLTFGPHKFTAFYRVPPDYLLDLHRTKNCPDKSLLAYIEKNLETIKARKEGKIAIPELIFCKKRVFLSEEEAKKEIRRIQSFKQKHKKPIRAYFHEKCGGWHLTSIPMKKWRQKSRFFKNKSPRQ